MAEQILSQNEVDALLKGLSDGDIDTEKRATVTEVDGVVVYDFEDQARSVRGKMPSLEMINEKFCRSVNEGLFNLLRKGVDVTSEGIETMRYSDFLANLKMPSSLNIFHLSPLRGQALLAFSSELVFIIVDTYFGGDGRFHTRIEGRDFTHVEQSVVKKVVDIIFDEMDGVWSPIHPVEHKFVRSETNPQFVNLVGAGEVVVVYSFQMEIESQSDRFSFCVPYTILEPIRDKLYGVRQGELDGIDKAWSGNIRAQLDHVKVKVSGRIGRADLNLSELLSLKVGDVVQLDQKVHEPIDVLVEEKEKFIARPGVKDEHYSIQILAVKEEGDNYNG